MPTPIDAFLTWYGARPKELRDEIANFMGFFVEELRPEDPLGAVEEPFTKWLKQPEDSLFQAGRLLTTRAVIELSFSNRFTREGWAETNARMGAMKAMTSGNPGLQRVIEQSQLRNPLREEWWVKAGDEWRELRSGDLSDPAFDKWTMARP